MENAGLGKRILGGIVDAIVLIIVMIVFGKFFGTTTSTSVSLEGAPALVFFLVAILYFVVMEATIGKTVGKYATKTKVVNGSGQKISWGQSFGRNLMRIVDSIPMIYLVGIIAIAASGKNQRLGDMAAKTYVIKDEIASVVQNNDVQSKV